MSYRVKVYKLNETGGWDDKGTGLVSVEPLQVSLMAWSSSGQHGRRAGLAGRDSP